MSQREKPAERFEYDIALFFLAEDEALAVSLSDLFADRYGRTIGVVLVDGRDANLEDIRAGMAWWYRQHARDQLLRDRQLYEAAENEARAQRRGRWVDLAPVAPWAWRHKTRR